MKKIFLFAVTASVTLSAFAQKQKSTLNSTHHRAMPNLSNERLAAKTTAVGDIDTFGHIFSTDTLAIYFAGRTPDADSGFTTGMNAFGDKGYAERYNIDFDDSSVQVTGVLALFTGTINPASTKTVKFYTWHVAPRSSNALGANFFNSGLPDLGLDSVTVPITQLGISTTGGNDTVKAHIFTTPSPYLSNFFVGYTINYDATNFGGDTIALLSNLDGERHTSVYRTSGTDTIINNQNATMLANGRWVDYFTESTGIFSHLFVFPIVKIGTPAVSVNGITRNNFTFYGNYPNPATNATNIKFSLANAADVTITISDITGKVVSTINEKYAAGTQVVNVNTSALAAGEYIYLIRTSEGDGIASKMSVIK